MFGAAKVASTVMQTTFEAPLWVKIYFGGVQAGGGILGVIGFFKPALVPSPPVLDGYCKSFLSQNCKHNCC